MSRPPDPAIPAPSTQWTNQALKDRNPGGILPLYDALEVGKDRHAERDADLEAEP